VDDGVGCIDGGNGSSVLHDHDAPLLPILLLETISVAPRKSPLLWVPLLDSLALRILLRTHGASSDGPPWARPGDGGKGRTDNTREGSPSIPRSLREVRLVPKRHTLKPVGKSTQRSAFAAG